MNVSETMASTLSTAVTSSPTEAAASDMKALTSAQHIIPQVFTTAAPSGTDSAVIAVVIVLILLTVAVLGFLLYRYLCHNKGAYRTTGEPAPGEDPEDEFNNKQAAGEKKEYFI
ncbi:hypothetical protein PBY51_001167 [Eleginops maclovinus]|uniref:Uncharacterized protein n=1 Tax=Eleginops maclovinus TaxID=56733 RepID=A0AAN8AR49_ELEMC|nr:hypothetical protein PBY51_001167 [Eleginops maclovinus]